MLAGLSIFIAGHLLIAFFEFTELMRTSAKADYEMLGLELGKLGQQIPYTLYHITC